MCDCIKGVNSSLLEAGHNTQIQVPITLSTSKSGGFGISKTLVATEKANTELRKKPIKLFASYCPFCGANYQPQIGKD